MHTKQTLTAVAAAFSMLLFGFIAEDAGISTMRAAVATVGQDTVLFRTATRLHERLLRHERESPGVASLARALEQRSALLRATAEIAFTTDDGSLVEPLIASVSDHPLWIEASISKFHSGFALSREAVLATLERDGIGDAVRPVDAEITSVAYDGLTHRADVTARARDGYDFDALGLASALVEALAGEDQTRIEVALAKRSGRILHTDEHGTTRALELLSEGRSHFGRSALGRKGNVRKAMNEHLNDVFVYADSAFSFNDVLGGSVDTDKGWFMATGIFNTDQLALTPGGGICQASTTLYRAILASGLPVLERRSHSLYVPYYEEYGVGLDATVFMGEQDLRFFNDTGNPLLIQSYTEDDDAYVRIYGVPDGRRVTLDGPYFAQTAPDGFLVAGRKLFGREIAWVQRIVAADGFETQEIILSRYKELPKGVYAKLQDPIFDMPLHASAR